MEIAFAGLKQDAAIEHHAFEKAAVDQAVSGSGDTVGWLNGSQS
jgi:hypothetical protein